jgi:hypothetical protein
MNYKDAIKRINKDYANTTYATYLKQQWGIKVGYNIVNPDTMYMRKKLADWQLSYDCSDDLCSKSRVQPIVIKSTAGVYPTGTCDILNPPLNANCNNWYRDWTSNVREILINSFTR